MELRHLRCFMAVAEELHFAQAAVAAVSLYRTLGGDWDIKGARLD